MSIEIHNDANWEYERMAAEHEKSSKVVLAISQAFNAPTSGIENFPQDSGHPAKGLLYILLDLLSLPTSFGMSWRLWRD